MTEVLNSSQLSFLRRVAAAGYVRIATAEEKATLDELVARKLILGNQLTDGGWRNFGRPEDRQYSFVREQKMIVDQGTPALQRLRWLAP